MLTAHQWEYFNSIFLCFSMLYLLWAVTIYWRLMMGKTVVSAHIFYLSAVLCCHGARGSRCGVLFGTIVIKHISGSITTQMHSHQGSTMGSQQMVAGVR